jgi:DNA-binding IclR family transcriptional regulator
LADAFAVATPLLAPDGSLIAVISAAVDTSQADQLDEIGEELKKAIATLGPKFGLNGADAPNR